MPKFYGCQNNRKTNEINWTNRTNGIYIILKKTDASQCEILTKCLYKKAKQIPVIYLRFIFIQRNYNFRKIGSIEKKNLRRKLSVKAERKALDLQQELSGS